MLGQSVTIFVCYSHEDQKWVDNLILWLQKNLERYNVKFWWDTEKRDGIRGGDAWCKRIRTAIDTADIAILLISDAFAFSQFIHDFEVPRIRERHRSEKLSIIPVLVSPVSEIGREELTWVYELQIVPSRESSLLECRENEVLWHKTRGKLQDEIYKRVKQHRTRVTATPPPPKAAATPPSKTLVSPVEPASPKPKPEPQSAPVSKGPPSGESVKEFRLGVPLPFEIRSEPDGFHIRRDIKGPLAFPGSRVTIDGGATVSGDVHASEIVILPAGCIRGNVIASRKTDIRVGATLIGDVTTARIGIENGAIFKGSIDILKPATPTKPLAATATAPPKPLVRR
jgi:cytoskeletal protein CcmA (bactofilin family)